MSIILKAMSISYIIALIGNCLGILVALFFIINDMLYHPSVKNGLLIKLTLGLCLWTALSYYLYRHDLKPIASTMAWVTAFPLLGYGVLILAFIILKPDMK